MLITARRFVCAASVTFALSLVGNPSTARAEWTTLPLPPLAQDFASYLSAHLPEGRLIYASNNDLDRQAAFGLAPLEDFANAGNWFPSDVAVFSDTLGAIGSGEFMGGTVSLFDPSNLATAFTPIPGVTIQNFSVVFRDAAGLYVSGANGSTSTGFGPMHSVSIVAVDGTTNKVIIDNISMFSADIAVDLAGNLLVADNDDGALYRFTKAQIDAAIAGAALSTEDGELLTTLTKRGSLAVDGLGRVWSAGFQGPGIDVFDPANGVQVTFYPEGGSAGVDNPNYVVNTFSRAGEPYVSYINAAGTEEGAELTYGYERAAVLIPEPSTGLLLTGAGAFLVARRRKTRI